MGGLVLAGALLSATGCASTSAGGRPTDASAPGSSVAPSTAPAPTTASPGPEPLPSVEGVPYGPDPMQVLDIHQPTQGAPVGVIVWLHAGGWVSGSRANVSEPIAAQTARGWAVVAVDHRLAPAAHAADLLADVDRALRWVRAEGAAHGLRTDTVVVAGGSAGGHLAAMAGAAAGEYVDADLPDELRAVSPVPDGVIDMVGPADLATFAEIGGWSPDTTSQLLGCGIGPTTLDLAPCEPGAAERFSPVWWARQAVASGRPLPPAYLAYGPADVLVPPSTQGDLLDAPWAAAAPAGSTRYDLPPDAGHNLEGDIDRAGFEGWLDQVAGRSS